jgi:uncharacterized protein (TIGR02147 family)
MKKNRLSTPIFIYEDYADYLRDWYLYGKRFGITQRQFLSQAGIKANAFLSDIISRRKKIGPRHVDGFVTALGLEGDEIEYFKLLVRRERSRKPAEKKSIIDALASLRKENLSSILESRDLEYFTAWRYPVIREYIVCKGSAANAKEISNALIYLKLSTQEVKQALAKLIKWNMIAYDPQRGGYCPKDSDSITYRDMPHTVVNDVKRSLIEASIHAMEGLEKGERHISMTLKGISKEGYSELCAKIDLLRQEFLARDENKSGIDRIVSLNVQLFPVMKIRPSRHIGGDAQCTE